MFSYNNNKKQNGSLNLIACRRTPIANKAFAQRRSTWPCQNQAVTSIQGHTPGENGRIWRVHLRQLGARASRHVGAHVGPGRNVGARLQRHTHRRVTHVHDDEKGGKGVGAPQKREDLLGDHVDRQFAPLERRQSPQLQKRDRGIQSWRVLAQLRLDVNGRSVWVHGQPGFGGLAEAKEPVWKG